MLRLTVAILAAVMLAGTAAAQDNWPDKPVKFIVPFPAGGTTDILARVVGQGLAEKLGQQFVVDNRAGAGGNIGTELVAKADPDGYTIEMGTIGTHAINVSLYRKLPYDPVKDFAPVSLVAMVANVVVVNPGVPAKTMQELIAYAKANPGKLNAGSPGNGTSGHLSLELLKKMAGIDIVHVPYRGSAPMLTDLLGGQIQMTIDNLPSALPHVKSGGLRALAVTTERRWPATPELPTVSESGVPGFSATAWFAVFAPAKTPQPIVTKLSAEIDRLIKSPAMTVKLSEQGAEAVGGLPQVLADLQATEIPKWAEVVKFSGAQID